MGGTWNGGRGILGRGLEWWAGQALCGCGGPVGQGSLIISACLQNLVMFMSDFVDWVIPDIPKDISQQVHKEKVLMVELFMREEQGKQQLLDTWMDKSHAQDTPSNNHGPVARARSLGTEDPGDAL